MVDMLPGRSGWRLCFGVPGVTLIFGVDVWSLVGKRGGHGLVSPRLAVGLTIEAEGNFVTAGAKDMFGAQRY